MSHDPNMVAALIRRDLHSFLRGVFPIVTPGTTFSPNWHVEAMTHALTQVLDGETRRLIITVPPRHLKSIVSSVALPAFALGRDPSRQIICVSYGDLLARTLADSCRAVMRSDFYQRVFPQTKLVKGSEIELTTTARGTRFATSVGGTLTGRGGSLIIIDDPMKAQDAHSESVREGVKRWYSHTLMSRLDDKSKDSIVVVMQRLHVDDLVGHLLDQGGWTHLNLPARADTDQRIPLGNGRVYLRRTGELLHPARESHDVLDAFKRNMGSLDFAAQYQQAPIEKGGNYIKWKWFQFYNEPPAYQSGDRIIVSWDTAISAKDAASFSVGMALQVRGESVWILDVVRQHLEYPDLKRTVTAMHEKWSAVGRGRYALVIENKGSGMPLIQELKSKNLHALAVEPTSDKETRMVGQTARIEAGSVALPRNAPWLEDFRHEICAFPSGRHNDQVDALSQGLDEAFNPQRRGESAQGFAMGLFH